MLTKYIAILTILLLNVSSHTFHANSVITYHINAKELEAIVYAFFSEILLYLFFFLNQHHYIHTVISNIYIGRQQKIIV